MRPLTLGDRLNFLSLTEPNPTEDLVQVKVSQQLGSENCYEINNDNVYIRRR
jgi:hypothetical protein